LVYQPSLYRHFMGQVQPQSGSQSAPEEVEVLVEPSQTSASSSWFQASPSSSWTRALSSDSSDESDCCSAMGLTLSRTQRVYGFIFCFAMGCLCSLMSTFFVAGIVVRPAKFALPYTFGNLLSIGSTGFLIGPKAQCQSMFGESRRAASLIYFASMALTLYSAFELRRVLPTLISVVIQFCAFLWYSLSYIPFGRSLIKSCFSKCWNF